MNNNIPSYGNLPQGLSQQDIDRSQGSDSDGEYGNCELCGKWRLLTDEVCDPCMDGYKD